MKCHLASLDSVDWCVMTNLVWFFRRLGFSVSWSKLPALCDVLVLVRGSQMPHVDNEVIDCLKAVILFDYVGNDQTELISGLEKLRKPILYFRARGAKSEAIKTVSKSVEIVSRALPVNVSLWYRRPKEIRWKVVYVGNRKNIPNDSFCAELNTTISAGFVDAWGRWWSGFAPEGKLHKPITVYSVPSVYSRSGVALGLMYPYQRENRCYSSRQWLAPLTGCPVASESANPFNAPGILTRKIGSCYPECIGLRQREDLAVEAASFWAAHTDQAHRDVADWLSQCGLSSVNGATESASSQIDAAPSLINLLRFISLVERAGVAVGRDVAPMSWLRIWA